tara:strand:+ start:3094 stop:3924 length:831 start_codon:yes stop_codon:yes gene_type:complete
MSNEIIEHGYSDIKIDETREGHIEHSLLAKEHFTHYMAVADFLSKSSMVPKGMTNKPADILIAMEMGLQLGIPMMQAIQDIAVINGKPCMYGDGLLAVVQGHKDYEWIQESVINDVATCTIKRKHHEPHSVSFSKEDAKKASLWGKSGPWTQYPDRMLKMRARGFCIRDIFSDALRGIKTDEEVNDYQIDAKPVKSTASDALKDLLTKKKSAPEPIKTIVLATVEQIEEIKTLIADKDFSQQRIDAACKHYNVNDIYTLDYHQANDFISQLNKKIN